VGSVPESADKKDSMRASEKGESYAGLMVFLTVLGLIGLVVFGLIAHRDAANDQQKQQTVENTDPAPSSAPVPPPAVQLVLEPEGFVPVQNQPNAHKLAGTTLVECGGPPIVMSQTARTASVGEKVEFTWDASKSCFDMTRDAPGGTVIVSKDGMEVRREDLPGEWGKGFLIASEPGYYSAKFDYHATCRNGDKTLACPMSGFVTIEVR
jgi:hypothetical protein